MKNRIIKIIAIILSLSMAFTAGAAAANVHEYDEPINVATQESYMAIGGAQIDVSGINLRTNPNLGADIIEVLPRDTNVVVYTMEGQWYYVGFENLKGWIYSPYVTFSDTIPIGFGQTDCEIAILRESPDIDSEIVGYINSNDTIALTGISKGWYETDAGYIRSDLIELVPEPLPEPEVIKPIEEAVSGIPAPKVEENEEEVIEEPEIFEYETEIPVEELFETGPIYADDPIEEEVELVPEPDPVPQYSFSEGERIVATAEKYLGVPYVWGGTSPSGFDCSGFTQYVFAECGYYIYRLADQQYYNGTHVSYSELQPGDLVFFERTYDEAGITHVAIYMGGGQIIHAASGGVKISSLSESYYASRYYGATRIV